MPSLGIGILVLTHIPSRFRQEFSHFFYRSAISHIAGANKPDKRGFIRNRVFRFRIGNKIRRNTQGAYKPAQRLCAWIFLAALCRRRMTHPASNPFGFLFTGYVIAFLVVSDACQPFTPVSTYSSGFFEAVFSGCSGAVWVQKCLEV